MNQKHYLNSKSVEEGFRETVAHLFSEGDKLMGGKSKSIGSEEETREILNFTLTVNNSRDRLVKSDYSRFSPIGAISRFIWMMGANNRISDVMFYWGKNVRKFSDDSFTMPGSNYGARMLTPRPGLNQITAIIKRLKEVPSTRRATISIFHPEDAVRESSDIPCALAIGYHVRGRKLHTTVIMRSSNAFFLLPFNLFEFSLLSEVVASEVGVELGSITVNAMSMHIYERDKLLTEKLIEEEFTDNNRLLMSPMPKDIDNLEEIRKLVNLEADVRHASMGITEQNIYEWIARGKNEMHTYWHQFYLVILDYIANSKLKNRKITNIIRKDLEYPWNEILVSQEENVKGLERLTRTERNLFDENDFLDVQYRNTLENRRIQSLNKLVLAQEKDLPYYKYVRLKEILIDNFAGTQSLAANNLSEEITLEEFKSALERIIY